MQSLREIVEGIAAKRFSAADVMRAHLTRIEALEPTVQAWEHLEAERALARAETLDRAGVQGPLHGVPLAVKDIIDVAGMPTRFGSGIFAAAPPAAESALCVQALEAAGAIVVGKSVTTEFAYYTPGKTTNPWNPAHTPGGSSMGSAASVACGMVAGALGTQTNGSVIRPAAFCGIVGFKPSLGAVANHGTMDPWPTLDHTGVFARTVDDAAALAAVIAQTDLVSVPIAPLPRPPRLALVHTAVWHLADDAQKRALESNAAALAEAGAEVNEITLPPEYDDGHRVHRVILAFEAARHFGEVRRLHRDRMSPRMNDLLDEGARVSESDYRSALQSTEALRAAFPSAIAAYDAVLTPPAAGEAPATLGETGNPAFCTLWTLLGVPAITLPVAVGGAGVPLGLQIVSRFREDDRLLSIAAWCESRLPHPGTPRQ